MKLSEMNGTQKAGWWTGKLFYVVPMTFMCIGWWGNFIVSLIHTLRGM